MRDFRQGGLEWLDFLTKELSVFNKLTSLPKIINPWLMLNFRFFS